MYTSSNLIRQFETNKHRTITGNRNKQNDTT
jgi:hypothetical protein